MNNQGAVTTSADAIPVTSIKKDCLTGVLELIASPKVSFFPLYINVDLSDFDADQVR